MDSDTEQPEVRAVLGWSTFSSLLQGFLTCKTAAVCRNGCMGLHSGLCRAVSSPQVGRPRVPRAAVLTAGHTEGLVTGFELASASSARTFSSPTPALLCHRGGSALCSGESTHRKRLRCDPDMFLKTNAFTMNTNSPNCVHRFHIHVN